MGALGKKCAQSIAQTGPLPLGGLEKRRPESKKDTGKEKNTGRLKLLPPTWPCWCLCLSHRCNFCDLYCR